MFSSRSSRVARGGLIAAFALSIAAATVPAGAFAADDEPLIDYHNFAGASKSLERNGTADIITSSGRVHQRILRLTAGGYRQSGSAWSNQKVDLRESFETEFKAYLHHGKPGADGIAFVVQTQGARALGGWGGGIGYRFIKPSVAVEFDTFQNTPDPSSNHLAVVMNGDPDVHTAVSEAPIPLYGKPFTAKVTYDAASHNLKVYVKSLHRGDTEQLLLEHTVDLTDAVGDAAWVGFTAATGTALSKQDIYSWTLDGSGV
ncbi:lectin [Actinoplanes sp. TBRC 11911]|uniref:L-type lectin-domain containing protein n=1 Tax=Actinoplanes sp. TBRC 11911 TaxID=2729386 RepID=UPI00145F125D|nr:L-type lectin-domain containing protein [Actinoplanes sp. TBRC 11911]NMO53251.1 lectin [Actinoplanes sp. TBRC 11911]